LDKLSGLTSLILDSNQITEIKGLDKLSGLTSLNLYSNQITEIKGLDKLSGLTSLDLDSNQITEIKALNHFTSLVWISLSGNQIMNINGIDCLKNLQVLEIAGNKLADINSLKKLLSLRYLSLYNNPLKDCPQALLGNSEWNNSFQNIYIWWKETEKKGNTIPNKLVKLQVLGNGNVGKSSIVEALKKGKCTTKFESTHGVLIETVEYKTGKDKVQFQAWDFGGQEIYHGTHKLFISSESVQMIVTDKGGELLAIKQEKAPDRVRQDEEINLQPLDHYIHFSKSQSPSSTMVIVQNKLDNAEEKSNEIYKVAAENNIEFCGVSAWEGYKIETLRALLAEKRKELLQYGMLMPKSWLKVQQFFMENLSRPEITRKPLITNKQFDELCTEYKVMNQARDSLKQLLHHTGLLYYDKERLKDIIIADQRWALNAIYKPLDRASDFYDEMRNDYKGRVRVKKLFKAFGSQYTTEQKWLFLGFMQSCGLCFPLGSSEKSKKRDEEDYYIFPEFLPGEETPAAVELWDKSEEVLWYRYNLEYLDYYRIQEFIAKIGGKTRLEYIWKYGIAILAERGMFRVEADHINPGIIIGIEEKAVQIYLKDLITTFNESNSGSKGQWTRGKEKSGDIFDVESLPGSISGIERGIDKTLQVHGESVSTGDKEQVGIESLRKNLADVVQQRPKRLVVSYASEDIAALEQLEKSLSNYEQNGQLQLQYDSQVVDGRKSWDESIQEMFDEADGFIILVSQDYQFVKRKKYIWGNEIPIIEWRNEEEKIFTWCITVGPVDYNERLGKFAAFRGGKAELPESGNSRAQFMRDFAKEVIEGKFLK
ncbi:MAG: leucine-rich repeat domain-containing protein, partial [Chitinophagaceae bacterium]|nr:leucine-rich repeat domain-containing protein [Chitinophagaceae bacterium]